MPSSKVSGHVAHAQFDLGKTMQGLLRVSTKVLLMQLMISASVAMLLVTLHSYQELG